MKKDILVSLLLSTMIIFGVLLTSCQPVAPETVVETVVETILEKETVVVTVEIEKEGEMVVVTATPEPKGGIGVWGFISKPTSLDPNVWTGRSDNDIMRQIYDSLVYSPEPGVYEPWLAKDWTISDDGLVYTFMLRDDVTFHDGTPMNAEAFKFAYDRMLDPATQSLRTGDMGPVDKIEVIDEYTFSVTLKTPFAPFLANASVLPLSPISPAAVEEFGDQYSQNPVGTGPFMFEKWEGNDLHLVRNPDYNWAPESMSHQGPAYLEKLVIREVQEAATRMVAIQTGEINYTHYPVYDDLNDLRNMGYKVYQSNTPGWVKSFPINIDYPPTDDLRVRQAMIYGLDRQQLVNIVMQGYADVAYGPLTKATFGYDPAVESYYNYDPEKAAALLEEAGWVDTNGDGIREKDGQNLTLRMIMFDSASNAELAEFAQALFTQMGFEATLDVSAYDAFAEAVAQGEFNTAEMNWTALDPSVVVYNMLHSSQVTGGGQFNRSHASSEELDALIDAGMVTTDTEERAKIYSEIQLYTMENALVIPIYDNAWVNLTAPNFMGLTYNLVGSPEFYNVWIED